jgi:hypothetical protein
MFLMSEVPPVSYERGTPANAERCAQGMAYEVKKLLADISRIIQTRPWEARWPHRGL